MADLNSLPRSTQALCFFSLWTEVYMQNFHWKKGTKYCSQSVACKPQELQTHLNYWCEGDNLGPKNSLAIDFAAQSCTQT